MQTKFFRNSSSILLLVALLWQTAFATGLQAFCIGSAPDAKIHVCTGTVICSSDFTDGCKAAPPVESTKSCCATPTSSESKTEDDCSAKAGANKFCTPDHQCQLVPHHVIVDRPAFAPPQSIAPSFIHFTCSDVLLTASLRTISSDSSPPRQLVQLLRTASRRAPPALS